MIEEKQTICSNHDRLARKIFLGAICFGVIMTVLHVFFNNYIGDDTAKFYAPMARAFAAGNYDRAFFPMIPPLMPVLGGLVAKILPLDAFNCLIVVSGIFFVATLFPLKRFLLNFLSPLHASWGCFAFICTPRLIKYAGAGGLTTGKLFFLLWALVLVIDYTKQRKISQLVCLGISLAGLSLVRGEGILYIPFLFISAIVLLYRSIEVADAHRLKKVFFESLKAVAIVGGVLLICLSPRMYQMHQQFGAPVLDARQASFFNTVFNAETAKQKKVQSDSSLDSGDGVEHVETDPGGPLAPANLFESLKRFLSGSYQVYLILAVFGIVLIIRQKRWNIYHTLIASLVAFNLLLFLPIAIASRYYTINVFLLMPFTMGALDFILQLCLKKNFAKVFGVAVMVVVFVQVRKGTDHAWKSKYRNNHYKIVGEWIDSNRSQFMKKELTILPSSMDTRELYQPGTDLIVASRKVQTAYWAKADHISLNDKFFTTEGFRDYMRDNLVDLIVAKDEISSICHSLKLVKEEVPQRIAPEIYCLNNQKIQRTN